MVDGSKVWHIQCHQDGAHTGPVLIKAAGLKCCGKDSTRKASILFAVEEKRILYLIISELS